MASSNFEEWLRRKTAELDRQLHYLHLEVRSLQPVHQCYNKFATNKKNYERLSTFQMLCNADLSRETLKDRTQVEIVDLVLKIADRLKDLDESLDSARTLLQSQISEIMTSVDDDLKSILLSNGALRECIWGLKTSADCRWHVAVGGTGKFLRISFVHVGSISEIGCLTVLRCGSPLICQCGVVVKKLFFNHKLVICSQLEVPFSLSSCFSFSVWEHLQMVR